MKKATPWVFALLSALLAPACGSIEGDVCSAKCDCEECNGDEYDSCRSGYDKLRKEIDQGDCLAQYNAYMHCLDDTSRCIRGAWTTSCTQQRATLNACAAR